jgi:hypothetical protein
MTSSRFTHLPIYRFTLVLLAIFASSLFRGGRLAYAENLGPGGGTRIIVADQVVGPYLLYATVSPDPAYPGTLTFAVRVADPTTNNKVLDANVTVTLTHGETGAVISGPATHQDAASPVDYAAHLLVEEAGAYNGVIRVSGPAGDAEVPFTQAVVKPRQWTNVILAGLPFLVILAVLGGFWFARSGPAKSSSSPQSS